VLFTSNHEATNLIEGVLPHDYLVDISSGFLAKLTANNYNEQAHFTPDGSKIVWMASTGLEGGSDYWMMNPDGSDHERVSWFDHPNVSDHPPKGQLYRCTDFSFRPDGNAIVAFIQTGEGPPAKGFIVIMHLDLTQ